MAEAIRRLENQAQTEARMPRKSLPTRSAEEALVASTPKTSSIDQIRTEHRTPVRKRVWSRYFDHGLILLDEPGQRVLTFNEGGAAVWSAAECGLEPDMIAHRLCSGNLANLPLAEEAVSSVLQHRIASPGAIDLPVQSRPSESPPDADGDGDGFVTWCCRIGRLGVRFQVSVGWETLLRPIFAAMEESIGEIDVDFKIISNSNLECSIVYANGHEISRETDAGLIAGAVHHHLIEAMNPGKQLLALLHSGAISKNGAGIALAAASGSGKSTLVAYLSRHGFGYMADDMTALTVHGSLIPWPMPISIKRGSWDTLAESFPELWSTATSSKGEMEVRFVPMLDAGWPTIVPLRALLFPRYSKGAAASMKLVRPLHAFARLTSDRLWLGHPITAGHVDRFLNLLARTPCYELTYDRLSDAAGLVDRLVESPGG